MGTLAKKIEQSFLDSVGGKKNPTTQKLGEEIEAHIAEFITKQPLTIKKMKARGEMEKLTTAEEIPANVSVETLLAPQKPQIEIVKRLLKVVTSIENILKKLNKLFASATITSFIEIPIPKAISEFSKTAKKLENAIKTAIKPVTMGGAATPALNLDKEGGDGGIMESRLYTYIGEESPGGESNVEESLVTLDKSKINLDY